MGDIVPYITRGGSRTELIKGKNYQVWSTKQEDAFRIAMMERYEPFFDTLLARDDFLRVLFFLERGLVLEAPLGSVGFPLLADPDVEFLNSSLDKAKVGGFKEVYQGQLKGAFEQFEQYSMGMMPQMFRFLFEDVNVRRSLYQTRGRGRAAKDVIMKAVSGHEKDIEGSFREFVDLLPMVSKTQSNTFPLLEAYENLEKGRQNYDLLCFAFENFRKDWKQLFSSIGKLVSNKILDIRIRSVCLECDVRRGLEPFRTEATHPGTWFAPERCGNCGGKTILHNLVLEVPDPLKLLMEENRIPELAIGYALSKFDQIKKVYVHKNVIAMENGVAKNPVQIDVLAVSNDDKILVVEVTKTHDQTNIMKNLGSKLKILSDNGIPYDLFVYVTGMEIPHPMVYNEKAKLLGIRQVATIDKQMREFLE